MKGFSGVTQTDKGGGMKGLGVRENKDFAMHKSRGRVGPSIQLFHIRMHTTIHHPYTTCQSKDINNSLSNIQEKTPNQIQRRGKYGSKRLTRCWGSAVCSEWGSALKSVLPLKRPNQFLAPTMDYLQPPVNPDPHYPIPSS